MQGNRKIYLYFSGIQHAGQNLTDVLENREPTSELPIQMSDALSRVDGAQKVGYLNHLSQGGRCPNP